ncbi:MAG: hypothetical protein QOH16_695 [Gaiellaceae bacterium]|nr:hypothetical protein [Gaiellaceae bacterium]
MNIVEVVQRVWSQVLETYVKEDSDFFVLGGDSLSAILAASALTKELELPAELETDLVVQLFVNPRPGDYANWLTSALEHLAGIDEA